MSALNRRHQPLVVYSSSDSKIIANPRNLDFEKFAFHDFRRSLRSDRSCSPRGDHSGQALALIISGTAADIDPTIFRLQCLVKLKDTNLKSLTGLKKKHGISGFSVKPEMKYFCTRGAVGTGAISVEVQHE